MNETILHIGPHKTGTTYIQKTFVHNRETLARLGITYPDTGKAFGHHDWVEHARRSDERALKDLLEAAARDDRLLLSSENFDRLQVEHIKTLRRAIGDDHWRILFFLRNHADLLVSWWQEDVKHGATKTFFEFAFPHIMRPFASKILSHRVVLDRYAKVFGRDSLVLVDYDRAVMDCGILKPIRETLGVELVVPDGNQLINKSFDPPTVELIRALNCIARAERKRRGFNVTAKYLQIRGISPTKEDISALLKEISSQSISTQLQESYFEKAVRDSFLLEYADRIRLPTAETAVEPSRKNTMLPGDGWLCQPKAQKLLRNIFEALEL